MNLSGKPDLQEGQLIRITTNGPVKFDNEVGYCGQVWNDRFEFNEVQNKYEHFSNISDPPRLITHIIYYRDVIDCK